MLETIVFLKCFMLTFGLNVNEMPNKEGFLEQLLTQSWETQQFVGGRSLVEEESMNELIVLRERRDTGKTKMEADEFGSTGSADDECSRRNGCSINATCNNTIGSYTCQCKKGFYGNGKTCKEEKVSQCECSPDAHCTTNTESYICKCKEGFYGNGKICEEILITTVMATLGGTAVLICTINENNVIWKKNGNIVKNSTKLIISKNLLIVKEVREDDFGQYVCDIKSYENTTIRIKLENINEPGKIQYEYLISLILLAILLLFSVFVIAYLVYSGKKKLWTGQGDGNGERDNEGNDIYEMVENNPTSTIDNEDSIYTDLKTNRGQESIYQGLVKQSDSGAGTYENFGNDDKDDAGKEKTKAPDMYEPLDLEWKTKV